ncbi:PREDICTED: protein BREVIS RADIX-like [Tarenaya hassleriana]|uniref:protein BREVIS RADIX-like n=1 Tax=Tarenaya hassleriana TaxID=28532 RepID=UPI00053C6F2C|nr:PREDICTED: protein BREVIS RADIX-like [Tarenaya hassleriana]
MFTCIACTKQMADGGEEVEGGARESSTPNTKEAVKSLTTQIKDMALKFSGAYKQCTGSSSLKKGQPSFPDFDTASEGVPYPYPGGSSSSTPAWDFTSSSSRHPAGRTESRFTAIYGGGRESISAQSCDVVLEDEDEPKEWMAQVEPGVHITFVSLPSGGNDLKRIRFSREIFDKWQAQRWWGENYDRIVELYNVQRFNRQAFQTPARSEDQRDSTYSRLEPARESRDWTPRQNYGPSGASVPHHFYGGGSSTYGPSSHAGGPSMDPARTTTSSRDEPPSISNASEMHAEWVEEDEPGVYITIRQLVDGTRELRRVRFSRERFGEVNAKTWWDQNRDRIQSQYL